MGSNGSAAKCYIRSVSDTLSCTGKAKNQIVSRIRDGVEDYLLQNPDAGFEMIQTHFGTPQEIAASYVNEQDASVLLKKMSNKKKVLVIVAGVIVAIFLMWMGVVAWSAYNAEISTDRFITEDIKQD